jgi:hypothetical protein
MSTLKAFINGFVPARELWLHDGIQLRRAVAVALAHAEKSAATQGVTLRILEVRNRAAGYRSRAIAMDLRAHKGLYNVNPNARLAIAALDSHGQGTAFDVGDFVTLDWLRLHGAHYRLYTDTIQGDELHVVYR